MTTDANNCWYNGVLVLVHKRISVVLLFYRREHGENQNINYFSKPHTALLASEPHSQAQQLEFCNWLNADRYILFHDGAQFTRYEANSSGNSYLRSKESI
jgi:hypothetical protein